MLCLLLLLPLFMFAMVPFGLCDPHPYSCHDRRCQTVYVVPGHGPAFPPGVIPVRR